LKDFLVDIHLNLINLRQPLLSVIGKASLTHSKQTIQPDGPQLSNHIIKAISIRSRESVGYAPDILPGSPGLTTARDNSRPEKRTTHTLPQMMKHSFARRTSKLPKNESGSGLAGFVSSEGLTPTSLRINIYACQFLVSFFVATEIVNCIEQMPMPNK